ncbi:hypothetical protein [Microbacterium paraoxydans]|uniref:hypothetical protein n=1 Tax=Microbacterium paraoxydans TaxID=199592 RepID=UPI0030137263
MSNITELESSLTELFDNASAWDESVVVHEADFEAADIRDIRTDISSLLAARPSGN